MQNNDFAENANTQLLSDLLQSERYQQFASQEFDASDYAGRALSKSSTFAQAEIEHLSRDITLFDSAIELEVTQRQHELLAHMRNLLSSEHSLKQVHLSVDSLQTSLNRVRANLTESCDMIRLKARQLKNIRNVVNMLRHIGAQIKLVKKLDKLLVPDVGIVDLAKAAKLLADSQMVQQDLDLSAVPLVQSHKTVLENAAQQIRSKAEEALFAGLHTLSQAEVGAALQVFFNLQELPAVVQKVINRYCSEIDQAARLALDSRQLGLAVSGGPGLLGAKSASKVQQTAATKWQSTLWSRIKTLTDKIHTGATALWHIQRVTAKKRDPATYQLLIDALTKDHERMPLEIFWDRVSQTLADQITASTRENRAIALRDALTAGYPRLTAALEALFRRFRSDAEAVGAAPACTAQHEGAMLRAMLPYQQLYLNSVTARLSDAVAMAFGGAARGVLPTAADVQKCIAASHEELKCVADSPTAAVQVATCVARVLEMLNERVQLAAAMGSDSRTAMAVMSVNTPCSAPQLRSIVLCSHLQDIHRALSGSMSWLPSDGAAVLSAALTSMEASAIEIVAPLFKAAMDTAESCILQTHAVNYAPQDQDNGVTLASPHVQQLSRLLNHFRNEFLARFSTPPSPNVATSVATLVQRMASRLLIFHARHASLIRPFTQAGKVQLVKDMKDVEQAVSGNLWPCELLGYPHHLKQSFIQLLFVPTPQIPTSPVTHVLPLAVVLHHVFARGPAYLKHPYERLGISVEQYSLWLDHHSHDEAVANLRAAFESVQQELSGDEAHSDVFVCLTALFKQQTVPNGV